MCVVARIPPAPLRPDRGSMHTTLAPHSATRLVAPSTSSTIAFVALLIALVARQVFAIWEGYDGSMTYDDLRRLGDAYWPMNLLVFGPAYAIGFTAQAILAWRLGRGRGRVVTWLGATLLLVGGTLFALVATAHSLPYDWASHRGILDEATGRAVVEAFDTVGTASLVPYILAAQAVIALGALVTAVGARLSGTLPTWVLVAVILLVLAFALVPSAPGTAITIGLALIQTVVWAVLGWFGFRHAQRGAGAVRTGE